MSSDHQKHTNGLDEAVDRLRHESSKLTHGVCSDGYAWSEPVKVTQSDLRVLLAEYDRIAKP